MTRTVSIELEGMPPEVLRKNGRPGNRYEQMRVTGKERDRAGEYVMASVTEMSTAPVFARGRVDVTAYWCGKPIDYDGLACGVGPWIDAFVDWDVLPDDSPLYVTSYTINYERVAHRHEVRVVITVTEA